MLNSDGTLRRRVQRKKVSYLQPISRVVREGPTFQYRDLLFQCLEAALLSGPVPTNDQADLTLISTGPQLSVSVVD